MIRHFLALACAPLLAVAGCGGAPAGQDMAQDLKFSEIRGTTFKNSCNFSSCHDSKAKAGGLDLQTDAHGSLVGVDPVIAAAKAKGLKRVVAGDEQKSLLYLKLVLPGMSDPDLGKRMPDTGQTLDAASIEQIKRWIKRGAPND